MGKLSEIGQVFFAVEINFLSSFFRGDREWHVPPSKFLMIYKLSNRFLFKNNLFFGMV